MGKYIDNMNIIVPDKFRSETWLQLGNKPCSINIMFEFDGAQTQVIGYFATATRHRHIKWCEELYTYCNKLAKQQVEMIYGNARPVADIIVDESGKVSVVSLAQTNVANQSIN